MKKLVFFCCITASVFAEMNLPWVVDPYFSAHAGANDLILSTDLMTRFGTQSWSDHLGSSIAQRLGRFCEMVLFWDPVNRFAMVAQHEVFGHGYRARSQRGMAVTGYLIELPFPYGNGGGCTQFCYRNDRVTCFDLLAVSAGGVEASAVLANRVRLGWLRQGKILPHQASLYWKSQLDLPFYILRSSESDQGDISRYLHLLAGTYPENDLGLRRLQMYALTQVLDPFLFYSFYAWGKYVSDGESSSIPMISWKSWKYLPSARLGLTPFGPEFYVEHFLLKNERPIYAYMRGSRFGTLSSWGMGIEAPGLFTFASTQWGLRCDLWRQPRIDYSDPAYLLFSYLPGEQMITGNQLGMGISLIAERAISASKNMFLQWGGKTNGFLPGEGLDGGWVFRFGISL